MKFTDTLKELEAKATVGPWIREGFSRITGVTMNGILRSEDAELIAYLRNHAQEIINLVEAAEMADHAWKTGAYMADKIIALGKALSALNKEQL